MTNNRSCGQFESIMGKDERECEWEKERYIIVEASFCVVNGCWHWQWEWLCVSSEEEVTGIGCNYGEKSLPVGIVGVWIVNYAWLRFRPDICMYHLFVCCGMSGEVILILLIVICEEWNLLLLAAIRILISSWVVDGCWRMYGKWEFYNRSMLMVGCASEIRNGIGSFW